MKSFLILPHIKVENANAISGLVYGFPAVTHFLGYVHALSRELDDKLGVKLGGCGIICHHHQIHAYQTDKGRDYIFSLTRNPLTKEGDTSPFNEEGRIGMEVSLVIECDFTVDDFSIAEEIDERQHFEKLVYQLAIVRHLAGGTITEMAPVQFHEIPQNEEKARLQFRRITRRLLPGFVLRDRSDLFEKYLSEHKEQSSFEGLLDFYALKYRATSSQDKTVVEGAKIKWKQIPKPSDGWIVPIQSGFKAISPIYEGGKVVCVRDPHVPFRFVEPTYGLGEWVGLHRIQNVDSMIWKYQYQQDDLYICVNEINRKI
jgi:CRISPR-associated protein Csy2